jgi:hypothetical protein
VVGFHVFTSRVLSGIVSAPKLTQMLLGLGKAQTGELRGRQNSDIQKSMSVSDV